MMEVPALRQDDFHMDSLGGGLKAMLRVRVRKDN